MSQKTPYMPEFIAELMAYFAAKQRDMPWRHPDASAQFDPYKIFVSEIMLQQTQVARVVPKYEAFLSRFPDIKTLAAGPLADVLQLWQGLGYNRRAKFLWQAAQVVADNHNGIMPETLDELVKLPGIGKNTAGAILVYAHNLPVTFIETNIRSVFIHHFFNDQESISDTELAPLIYEALAEWQQQASLGPREFYWALMDYGTYLKATNGNSARRSKTYAKQSVFKGSKRQVRGAVLRVLSSGPRTIAELQELIPDERLNAICEDLAQEGLISQQGNRLSLGA